MHATFAYLNAAGKHATRSTRSDWAFIRVMDTLLANSSGPLASTDSPHPGRRRKALPGQPYPTGVRNF